MDRDAAREQVLKQCGTVLAGPGNPVEFRDRQRVTGTDDCEQRWDYSLRTNTVRIVIFSLLSVRGTGGGCVHHTVSIAAMYSVWR